MATLIIQGRMNTAPTSTSSIAIVASSRCLTGRSRGTRRPNIPRSRRFCASASSSSISDRTVWPRTGLAIGLDPHQLAVGSTVARQLTVSALRGDTAVSQQQDPVGHENGRELAGDDQHGDGSAAGRVLERANVVENGTLRGGIERTGRIVQTQNGRFG